MACLRFLYLKLVHPALSFKVFNPKLRRINEGVLFQFYRQFNPTSQRNAVSAISINAKTQNRTPTFLLVGVLTWLGFKDDEEKEDVLITTIKRGVLCLQREEYEKAETFLHLALKLAQERQDMEGQRYIFDLLANAAYNKEDFPKAEGLFLQVMKELLATGTPVDDNSIIEISLKLATIYSYTNDDSKAVEGYRFCIETQQKKVNLMNLNDPSSLSDLERDSALLCGMSLDWFARHLCARGLYKGALENFQKALDISEKVNGPSHPQTLILMNDVGSVASLRKDYDKAIELFENAITRVTKDDMYELPTFYCNLGATYFQTGNYDKAKKACLKALKLAKEKGNNEAETDAKECLEEVKDAKEKSA